MTSFFQIKLRNVLIYCILKIKCIFIIIIIISYSPRKCPFHVFFVENGSFSASFSSKTAHFPIFFVKNGAFLSLEMAHSYSSFFSSKSVPSAYFSSKTAYSSFFSSKTAPSVFRRLFRQKTAPFRFFYVKKRWNPYFGVEFYETFVKNGAFPVLLR